MQLKSCFSLSWPLTYCNPMSYPRKDVLLIKSERRRLVEKKTLTIESQLCYIIYIYIFISFFFDLMKSEHCFFLKSIAWPGRFPGEGGGGAPPEALVDVDEEPGGSAPSAPATKLQEMRRRDDLDPSARMRSEGWKIPPVQNCQFSWAKQKDIKLLLKI